MNPVTTRPELTKLDSLVIQHSPQGPDQYLSVVLPVQPPAYAAVTTTRGRLETSYRTRQAEWDDEGYRRAYLEESIEQGVAWQIRANRQQRGLTQRQLADQLGTHQSAVSRLEDPMGGLPNLQTLLEVAHVFDCALSVRFISYARLAVESDDLSPAALYAAPYAAWQHVIEE